MTRLPITYAVSVNQKITLDEDLQHYVRSVLRLVKGSSVILFNGNGNDYIATIQTVNKKTVVLEIVDCIANDVESPLAVTLLQGIAKGERMDFVMQKATELGVTKIIPVVTEYCVVKQTASYRAKKPQHWQSVANFAAAQSGRAIMPKVTSPMSLVDALTALAKEVFDAKLALSLTGQPASRLSKEHPNLQRVTVLVGPEGGLSVTDLSLARQYGFDEIKLGRRVLRTETAALAMLSVLQSYWGDF